MTTHVCSRCKDEKGRVVRVLLCSSLDMRETKGKQNLPNEKKLGLVSCSALRILFSPPKRDQLKNLKKFPTARGIVIHTHTTNPIHLQPHKIVL
jgi:hypothetical protein